MEPGEETIQKPEEGEEGLGFDPKALVLGLLLWYKYIIVLCLFSCLAGVVAGLVFGTQKFDAETVLQYKKVGPAPTSGETTFILTQMNLVKLESNLEELRRRLSLPVAVSVLGSSIDVRIQKNTTLLNIGVTWTDPETAARIANTIRDVFLEQGRRTRKTEAQKSLDTSEGRLVEVRAKLVTAEQKLASFTQENNVVDLDKEAQWYLEQLTSLDMLVQQAKVEKQTIDLQVANLDRIISELNARVAAEKKNAASVDNLGDLNIKVERLRDAIHQDKQYRAGIAELNQSQQEYEKAKLLFQKRLIAAADVEKAKNAYERQKALTIDTEQTKAWKAEVERLNKQVIPQKGAEGPSGPLLREMMLKSFSLSLEEVGVSDKVKSMEEARQKAKEKLNSLPRLQREFAFLTREVSALESEKKTIEENAAQIRQLVESNEYDFTVISDARPSPMPVKSTRKLLAAGTAGFMFGIGMMLILLLEITDTSIRSGHDLTAKLGIPVLTVLPHDTSGRDLFPGEADSPFMERFRILAHRVRAAVPKPGAIILVVSARHGEGRTLVASSIAACLGRMDERVLVLDAQVRDIRTDVDLKRFLPGDRVITNGLGEYLSFNVSEAAEAVVPSNLPGVSCVPRVGAAVIPDLLASNRMKEMLAELRKTYSVLIIDAPPIMPYVDADVLAKQADAAILVVKSRFCRAGIMKKAVKRIEDTGLPILGAVFTGYHKIFGEEEY